ncbi:hypothetical protein EP073_10815 [Geovibrio thiophilus]|uniref:Uncharacterized protein n=1 Tax=Geovibrio thiophilus TaxID=139438 RepID=A0A3R5XYI3_9BACT|nr:hypothetical protein [Geovibrio thiophilus]QAR33874.1 hypothetical protein EP073_10815 [Geovibrio thiophilus]
MALYYVTARSGRDTAVFFEIASPFVFAMTLFMFSSMDGTAPCAAKGGLSARERVRQNHRKWLLPW